MSRLLVAQRALTVPGWAKDELSRKAQAIPSLDLRFADNKSLVDATTGQNLVTFTRASSGTFVGSDGVLRTAVTNLLLRSEEINDGAWGKYNVTIGSNVIAAPNGTLTADKIEETAATTFFGVFGNPTVIASTTYTLSFFAKAAERNAIKINFTNVTNGTCNFNLDTGASSSVGAGISNAQSQSIGDGWRRYSAQITTATSGSNLAFFIVQMQNPGDTYAGTAGSGIFLWGAQLEQSATVGEYIPTTSTINSAPRFDHNPTTGESLGLLVEEQRTNLTAYSEDVSQWASPFNTTLTANGIAAPDGVLTADRLLETTATNLHTCDGTAFTFVTSTVYTYSVFVKPIGDRNFEIAFPVTIFTARFARFTLSGAGVVQGVDSGVTASIQALANGWYRCSASSTCASGGGSRIGNFINNTSNSRTYTGDITKGIYIWGAQLEAGAFPTSYIKSEAAAATRSADVCSITGSAFSGWYRQDEGTVFAEGFQARYTSQASTLCSLNLSTAPFGDRIQNYMESSTPRLIVTTGGVDQAVLDLGSGYNAGVAVKIISSYLANNFTGSFNGGTPVVDSSGTVPTANRFEIGAISSIGLWNGTIRRLTYWPVRLGNNVLQQITQ